MFKITLSGKTYTAPGVTMRSCIDAYRLCEAYEKNEGITPDDIDRYLGFIADLFGNQFSIDQLKDGYVGSPFVLIPQLLRATIGYVHERIEVFPTPATAIQTDPMMVISN